MPCNLAADAAPAREGLRDVMFTAQLACYPVLPRQGTFYLSAQWRDGGAERQWRQLANRDVFVLSDRLMNTPDHFRISLTASDAMVARTLPMFAEVPHDA
jgi:aspartate aminotransferase